MNDVSQTASQNKLLNSLTADEAKRLHPHLEPIDCERGDVYFRPEESINYLYFPLSSMISVVGYTEQGTSAEVGVIGMEGAVGVDTLLGADSTANETFTQIAGAAVRINAAVVKDEFQRGGAFQREILFFIHKMIVQISQTAVCNRLHSLEERLARWLLMCRDRTTSDDLKLTQEFLSIMVGSTRASVTLAAIDLQGVGYIAYKRGLIKIVDREGLEDFACNCYQTVKKAYEEKRKH